MTAKKTNYAADYPTEYEQGRRARLSSVSRDDAPYSDVDGEDGKPVKSSALGAWNAGYDDAEGEAARNETSGPQDDGAKAGDQTSVVADANKAKASK
jgi:hypothetical protein